MTDPAARKVDAIVAILERQGRYLLGKRSPWKPVAPGYWCPISGRVEHAFYNVKATGHVAKLLRNLRIDAA